MMKKILAFSAVICIIVSICTVFSSCEEADIIVSQVGHESYENTAAGLSGEITITVNISSGTFHLDENCRYAAKINEKNKKTLIYSDARTALEDGYIPCSLCAGEYKD